MQARPSSPRPVDQTWLASAQGARHRPRWALLVASLRPEQWSKNLLVFAGPAFGARLLDPPALWAAVATFAVFCALSGAVYLFNDLADVASDREHPVKRARPIASGQLPPRVALVAGIVLGLAALAGAVAVRPAVGAVAAGYLVLLSAYSALLKHYAIIDVLTIAAGFVLRAAAGALAVDVKMSDWLLVCTTLLALFLALSKRRHELTLLADGVGGHRRILEDYSPYLLDQMISVVTASTLVAYCVYATSADTSARLGTTHLSLTIPFVIYGIFRYLYLVHRKEGGGSPADLLLTDKPLLACVGLWAGSVVALLYSPLGR
uniref:Putative conserved membrane protein n=1 Tax=uncultured Acidobacteriota bacterium TaxID=171953 RepID=Q7X2W4_9BACT|nr:putative conserved membrane protein [uncultured Acidobacteriota bacterium]